MDPMFFLTHKSPVSPVPGTRIIKKESFGKISQANEILAHACRQADQTIAQANEIYEAKKQQGYEDGLEAGRLAHSENLIDTTMKAVSYLEAMEKDVAGLVMQCLEKVIGDMDNEDLVLRIVRAGLAVARNENRVRVRVCEDDLPVVSKALSQLLAQYPGINCLDVSGDSRLKKNACLVESELGVVDASLSTQMEAIRRAISKRM